jgi:hypothetical protein
MKPPKRLNSRILEYAQEAFLSEVDGLLEDPSEMILGRSKEDKRVMIIDRGELTYYSSLAAAFGWDFEQLLKERGDNYQRERMRRMLASEPSDHETVLATILGKNK